MFFVLLACISFFILHKSIFFNSLPPWLYKTKVFLLLSAADGSSYLDSPDTSSDRTTTTASASPKTRNEVVEESGRMSLLDLPDLALEGILERLSPAALRSMAEVCTSLRDTCLGDRLWERHMDRKWGRLMGPAARREWHWHVAAAAAEPAGDCRGYGRGFTRLLSPVCPRSWLVSRSGNCGSGPRRSSAVSCYFALESGRFRFPAQVYNRENGHVGFLMSCYDAEVSYDMRTDTFQARYPPHGRRAATVENGIPWERLRAQPIDITSHDLHISDCLSDLHPGDHIEIQWRRNKDFPYGWWYGVVGHLESCNGSENFCRCNNSDSIVLEFNQYTQGSRWRYTTVSRKEHREEGNEATGFYGGIRKLCSRDEISTWEQLWPASVLE